MTDPTHTHDTTRHDTDVTGHVTTHTHTHTPRYSSSLGTKEAHTINYGTYHCIQHLFIVYMYL